MISVEDARSTILKRVNVMPSVKMPLLESFDHVLDEDIFSPINMPLFDNSAMDGYALRSPDVASANEESPVLLDVIGDVAAGYVFEGALAPGQAIRIMTGAPVPEGADCVVMVEYTEQLEAENKVKILRSAKPLENIREMGSELRSGDLVISKGKVINAPDIGLLASMGYSEVTVIRKPVVAILATGDEVIDITEELRPGKLRNSNSYALAALVKKCGGVPRLLGIAMDTADDVTAKVQEGLKCDLLITTGGVSVGDFDMVKKVLMDLGEMLLWKVAMKPGKPLAFGVVDDKLLFGLPGNPAASLMSFELFVRPTILMMQGREKITRPQIEAVYKGSLRKKPGRRHHINVKVDRTADGFEASSIKVQNSSMLSPMSVADGFLVFPEESAEINEGDMVKVIMTDWPEE